MAQKENRLRKLFNIYFSVINHRTLISVFLSILATWLSYRYKLIFNLDLTLISVAVVFPLVFSLGSAFQRREKALEHLGRVKGALSSIKYLFSFSKKISDSEKEKIYQEVHNVKTELIVYLHSESDDREKLNQSISKIQEFIEKHRGSIGRGLSSRIYRLMRDVIMGLENTISIKTHRTPKSIRAYCELFIYIFPFFYAPTLIKNIEYQDILLGDIIASPNITFIQSRFDLIIYGLNIVLSFFLITLFNVQEQIENPFDQDGIDDIKLGNFELDY